MQCGESVGFSFRVALWFPQWFCLCEVYETNVTLSFDLLVIIIFTVKCNDSVSFSFLFLCFLFSSLRTKWLHFNWRKSLCFEVFCVCTYFNYNRFRVLLAVDSLNVKDELRSTRSSKEILSAVMYNVDISKRYFLVCHLKVVFYFLHVLKQRVVTSLDSINGRSIQTLPRE